MRFIAVIIAFMICYNFVIAQTPPPYICDPEYHDPMPKVFIISQSSTRGYIEAQGGQTYPQEYQMGDFFFGKEERNGRVWLGKYDDTTAKFTSMIGWIPLDHILPSRYAQTVGQGVERGYLKKSDDQKSSAFSINNHLFLRVLAKPEQQISPSSMPGVSSNRTFLKFAWYYVMDYQVVGGIPYYLVSDQEKVLDSLITETEDKEYQEYTKNHLLGWIPAERVHPWPSNLVLEYNTRKEAIQQRCEKKLPAHAYQTPEEDKICGTESLSLWQEWMDNGSKGDVAKLRSRPDPYGLAMDISRFHIIEQVNDEWYKTGTLGTSNHSLDEGEIGKLLSKLDEVKQKLQAVDICFVVDGSDSMEIEINTVRQFCIALCQGLAKSAQNSASYAEIENPITKEKYKCYVKMDIKASLVVYKNTWDRPNNSTEIRFRGISLETGQAEIEKGFDGIVLNAGNEDLHEGLHTALTAEGIWRPYATRFVIVIGDEKGESTDQDRVFQAMPLPKLEIAQELGLNTTKITQEQFKKEYTRIIGIYTAPADDQNFEAFKKNLNQVANVSIDVVWIENFVDDQSSRERLTDKIKNHVKEAEKNIVLRLQNLMNKISMKTPQGDLSASMIINDIALEIILKEAKITLQDLQRLNNVAFLEGYVKIKQSGHKYNTFRQRILISKTDLSELRDQTNRIAVALEDSLKQANPAKARKQVVAEALVLAIAFATNTAGEYVGNPTALTKAGRELIQEAESKGGDITIRQKIKMRQSLPTNPQGILGMPIQKVITLPLKEVIEHTRRLKHKVTCFNKILNNEIAPEIINQDFSIVVNWEKTIQDKGGDKRKNWFFPHPVSGIMYTYMPLEYLP